MKVRNKGHTSGLLIKFDGFAYRAGQEQGVVQLPGQEPPFHFRGTPPPHDQASDAAPKRRGG